METGLVRQVLKEGREDNVSMLSLNGRSVCTHTSREHIIVHCTLRRRRIGLFRAEETPSSVM